MPGIVDVTMLLGWFTGVSLTLMAFDVPSNAIGLKQYDAIMQSDNLGGRLPLLDPAKLSETQREVYDIANSDDGSVGRGRSVPEQDLVVCSLLNAFE